MDYDYSPAITDPPVETGGFGQPSILEDRFEKAMGAMKHMKEQVVEALDDLPPWFRNLILDALVSVPFMLAVYGILMALGFAPLGISVDTFASWFQSVMYAGATSSGRVFVSLASLATSGQYHVVGVWMSAYVGTMATVARHIAYEYFRETDRVFEIIQDRVQLAFCAVDGMAEFCWEFVIDVEQWARELLFELKN